MEKILESLQEINPSAVGFMLFNFLTSVGIVLLNKIIFLDYNFKFGTTLTFVHFVCTFLGLCLCNLTGLFEIKVLSVIKVMPLCFLFCGFVVFNNLSLQCNSVGFYQLMKVATTPVIVVINTYMYKQSTPPNQLVCLALVCVGVIIASVTDVSINFLGLMYALAGVITTSFYQIKVGRLMKELDASSMQLLFYQAPLSALLLIPIIPVFDNIADLYRYEFNNANLTAVVGSGFVAFGVNLSIFLVIGKTSALSYNVLGHFKLCVILLSGYVMFGEEANAKKGFGVFLTLAAVFYYTHLNLQAQAAAKNNPASAAGSAEAKEKLLHKDDRK